LAKAIQAVRRWKSESEKQQGTYKEMQIIRAKELQTKENTK
jgi:hypothetical protein